MAMAVETSIKSSSHLLSPHSNSPLKTMPSLIIDQSRQEKDNVQFHIAKATSPLLKRKMLNEYYVQTVIQHSRGESSKVQTDKAKVQSSSRQVIWDENSPPLVVQPDDLITFHLWSTHHPIASGIVASTETCRLHALMGMQGKVDDRESYIPLSLYPESKPPLSPQRSHSPRSPRRSTESSGSGTTESHSSSRSTELPSELVINIRTIIRDSPKSAQEWNEARLKSLRQQQQEAGCVSPTTEAGPSSRPLSVRVDPPYVVQVC